MRKRRSTVYVSPGKDVTLYVPADTPSEVIDYLNRLKDEGQFSQGVMDILIRSITAQAANSPVAQHNPAVERDETAASQFEAVEADHTDSDEAEPEPVQQKPSFHLRMADIFRQAQKNTSKLAEPQQD
ncbi:hypothetical protein JZ785_18200 [Alicyclobacillus curvatus]|nr:hypothetical protein JZ785_18200 [Alicyclobacillus curvatus]